LGENAQILYLRRRQKQYFIGAEGHDFPFNGSLSEKALTSPLRLCAQLTFLSDENQCEFLKETPCCECACSRNQ
jgi:hypothetical protein